MGAVLSSTVAQVTDWILLILDGGSKLSRTVADCCWFAAKICSANRRAALHHQHRVYHGIPCAGKAGNIVQCNHWTHLSISVRFAGCERCYHRWNLLAQPLAVISWSRPHQHFLYLDHLSHDLVNHTSALHLETTVGLYWLGCYQHISNKLPSGCNHQYSHVLQTSI